MNATATNGRRARHPHRNDKTWDGIPVQVWRMAQLRLRNAIAGIQALAIEAGKMGHKFDSASSIEADCRGLLWAMQLGADCIGNFGPFIPELHPGLADLLDCASTTTSEARPGPDLGSAP